MVLDWCHIKVQFRFHNSDYFSLEVSVFLLTFEFLHDRFGCGPLMPFCSAEYNTIECTVW